MHHHLAEDAASPSSEERHAEQPKTIGENADALIAEVLALFVRFPYTLALFLFRPGRAAAAVLVGVFFLDHDISCSSPDQGRDRCWELMRYPGYLVLLRDVRLEADGAVRDAVAVPGGSAQLVRIIARSDGEVVEHPRGAVAEFAPMDLVATLEELIAEFNPWIQVQAATRTRSLESYWAPARAGPPAAISWRATFEGVTYMYR